MASCWKILCVLGILAVSSTNALYKGTHIGKFSTLHHDVVGDVYAIDNITIYVEGFSYDGEAPDAYFFAGNRTPEPSNRGFIIPDERGRTEVLGPYRNRNLVLRFPKTKKGQRSLNDVQWVSVWCRRFAIDFGHVKVPSNLELPQAQRASGLESDNPQLRSSSVMIADIDTFVVEDFSFDGTVPDAIFVMGSGNADASGSQVPDEKGSLNPLRKYNKKTLTLPIPAEVVGQSIQYFGVWSPSKGMLASVTFNPNTLLPPSMKSLQ
ncbi:protein Skeletor, isoforms B/C-like [Palaemon carinicauda]|uniref:protein Skeletor, isoforms B/C-like n=1 Tax=Palaemon carinicauda TaxID=392227 RepID=UPI0035B60B1E